MEPRLLSVPVIQLIGISKAFGPVQALRDVSLDLRRGEVHCLAGENGAGKSTLIRILTGAVHRDRGEYYLDGRALGHLDPAQMRALGIGVVYQELSLLPDLSVQENLLMGRLPNTAGILQPRALREQATRMLARIGLASLDPQTPVSALPLATRQMVEIAKVFGANARLIIFDEPTTALAEDEVRRLLQLIRQLRSEGMAILYVTHRLEEIFEIGDRITVLRDGQVVASKPVHAFDRESLIGAMVGRQIESLYPGRQEPQRGRVVLSVRGLRLRGSPYAIDLTVHAGEILGIGGLVGSGRTSLLRAIFGADPVAAGEISIDGKPLRSGSPHQAVKAGLGLLSEDRKELGLLIDLSIRENVTIAKLPAFARFGIVSRRKEQAVLNRLLPSLRVKFHTTDQPVSSLSGGNQQKVLLARWLATHAKVLLLDEPTKGIDVGAKADIYALIGDLAAQGLGIVVVSSYLPELLGLCDRVVVVHDRGITGELSTKEATEEAVIRLASETPVAARRQ
ncbi:sugar ABC transporter ATP-binding protein [Thermogemmatispora carboxidivorans]|uniref:sugar ABC transporter ATP-binding protein n=1 Tax=Thermogemmatispora carboxidivorans TaxID=1382306 RepID=UPI000ACCB52E|nr:sugar ABC transporter ATP-binding protein [Thermogemmatispora carboxidivorans]